MRIFLLASFVLLSGCYSSIQIDQALLDGCPVSPPPTLTGNDKQDVKSISSAWMDQTSNLGNCNDKLKTIKDKLKGD